ncbi:MAG: hypothetical protein Q7S14_01430 [bacterium]|nr:hypothetical protein [bacterium]
MDDKSLPAGIIPSKLYTHNVDVDAINNFELAKINKPDRLYKMTSRGNPDLIAALKKGCLAFGTRNYCQTGKLDD